MHLFEEVLQSYRSVGKDAEAIWDKRAKSFGAMQGKEREDSTQDVVKALLDRGLLEGQDVLDVGGGNGRYALPFSVHARTVTIADISSQMLAVAKDKAERAGYDNMQYRKLDWHEADLKALGWEKRFDLVFASMSEAYRSREGIEKMCAASRNWCQINQLLSMKDSISARLEKDLALERVRDIHNTREITQAVFNILWTLGYDPEVSYLRKTESSVLSLDDAISRYTPRFAKAAEEKGQGLGQLLKTYLDDSGLVVENRTVLSIIRWNV